MIRILAHAKLNLGLHVLRKREDGFHDIDTVFLAVPWHDTLLLERADALTMSCSDPRLPTDETNLCLRAAMSLASALGCDQGAHIHLEKQIPFGAGLGGGSSDAAAVLRALPGMWGREVDPALLQQIALNLGSDVPFFLQPEAARGEARGEVLSPLQAPGADSPYRMPYPLAVVVPAVHVATGSAYEMVRPRAENRADLEAVVLSNDLDRWNRELVNDFQEPVCRGHPGVGEALQVLLGAGARYASLSGSGSSVFGVFEKAGDAEAAASGARGNGLTAWWGFAGLE